MRDSRGGSGVKSAQVFLNVPYNKSYERTLLGLTAALVALGRVPRLTFEVPDVGQGRMSRIFELLKSCRFSIHDLSAVGTPVRFNMPFELGLACAIKEQTGRHDFVVLERQPYRFHKNLSDLGGIDPKIHGGTVEGAIAAVLEVLTKPGGNPSAEEVLVLYRRMLRLLPTIKRQHRKPHMFNARVYGELVTSGWVAAKELDFA